MPRLADTAKGNRPSFSDAAPPEEAEPLYGAFCVALDELGVEVATGVFGARMEVELVNDGPVTIVLGPECRFSAGSIVSMSTDEFPRAAESDTP